MFKLEIRGIILPFNGLAPLSHYIPTWPNRYIDTVSRGASSLSVLSIIHLAALKRAEAISANIDTGSTYRNCSTKCNSTLEHYACNDN